MHISNLDEKDGQYKTSFFGNAFRQVLVSIISWYQKYFYRLKGFYCAHRVLHGDEFCSEYIKSTFLEQDLMTAISMSRKRIQDCACAHQVLIGKSDSQVIDLSNFVATRKRNQKAKVR